MLLKEKIILILFLLIGTFIQVIPVIRSGLQYDYGIGFWGPMGHDGVWHLSLINSISNPFNIDMPIFAGEKLINYHPFFDILISFLSNLTHISSSIWLFQIFPIISSFFILYLSFKLGTMLTGKFSTGIILLLLNTLSNSFGWIVTLVRSGTISGESIFWAMQSPSNQINPPYSLSLILILILLITIKKNLVKPKLNLSEILIISLILILLPIIKAYSGLLGFSLFSLYCLFNLIKYKNKINLIILIISLIASILLFNHYNPISSGIFVFKPFWFLNSMIDSPDRFYFPLLSSLRLQIETANSFSIKLIPIYGLSLFIFIVGNYSWKLLGLLDTLKKPDIFKKILALNILILTLIPLLFIQKGTSWNTIQFLYYALFLSNILLAIYLNNKNKIIIGVIFVTYIIGLYGSISEYFINTPPSYIPTSELKALNYLKLQPSGTILTFPYDDHSRYKYPDPPMPLYAYTTTSYISAYSLHQTYLEDETNLSNSGYNFESRRKQSQEFFTNKYKFQSRGFLVNNKIDYIYITGLQNNLFIPNLTELSLVKIFDDSDTIIYKVQR